jgi:hypothetical protein
MGKGSSFDRSVHILFRALGLLIAAWLLASALTAQGADLAGARTLQAQIEQLEKAERHSEAIPLAENQLAIFEKALGAADRETAAARGRAAELYVRVGLFARAEALLRRGFAIHQESIAPASTRGLLTGRAFWLPNQREPEQNYGLYSVLLFAAPPKDQLERSRFLKALEAYLLLLQPMAQLERHRPRSQLNITLSPVTRAIELSEDLSDDKQVTRTAERILAVYDYARAQSLLDGLDLQTLRSGPYLVSAVKFDSRPGLSETRLLLDMSHVAPQLVWDWIRTYCWLAAQERSWSQVALQKLLLNIRNVIGIAEQDVVRLVPRPG